MSEATQAQEGPARDDRPRRDPRRTLIIAGIVVVVVALLVLLAVTAIPRWWAQRVGGMVDGSMTAGVLLGVLFGVVFTVLPLLALWLGVRLRRNWKHSGLCLLAAILLASPNLATLGIVLGNGNAAHAGDRILDVEGPGFRAATLVGAIIGGIAVVVLIYLSVTRFITRRRGERLRRELDRHGDDGGDRPEA